MQKRFKNTLICFAAITLAFAIFTAKPVLCYAEDNITTSKAEAETETTTEVETASPEPVITISDGQTMVDLQDNSSWSRHDLAAGTRFTITNASEVQGIYIMWDTTVGPWTLIVDGNEYTYGKQGFLHEYVELPQKGDVVEVVIPEGGMTVCEFWAFTCGIDDLPDWVQVWDTSCDEADMLLIPTHADDEILFFGGAMAYYAGELGYDVQVAYFTNHWQERYRPHELLDGLWTCGITHYPVIGPFTDYYSKSLEDAKKLYDSDECLRYMVELLRRYKPKVVIGHDINGEYGHGVHMLNTYYLMQALEISNNNDYYPDLAHKYGLWDVPKTYLHLYGENQIEMQWDTPLDSFDGMTGFDVAVEAFKCHLSQQKYYSVTRDKTVYGCTQFGLYRSLVGNDIDKNDFFENIDFADYEPETETESETEPETVTETEPETALPAESDEESQHVKWPFIILIVAIVGIVVVSFMYMVNKRNRR